MIIVIEYSEIRLPEFVTIKHDLRLSPGSHVICADIPVTTMSMPLATKVTVMSTGFSSRHSWNSYLGSSTVEHTQD